MVLTSRSYVHERSAERGWRASAPIFAALAMGHLAALAPPALHRHSSWHMREGLLFAGVCTVLNLLALRVGVRRPLTQAGFVTIASSVALWSVAVAGIQLAKWLLGSETFDTSSLALGPMLGLLAAVITAPLAYRGALLHHPRTARDDAGETTVVAIVMAVAGDFAIAMQSGSSRPPDEVLLAGLAHGFAWFLGAASAALGAYAVGREIADRRGLIAALSGRSPAWRIDPVSKWMDHATTLPIMRWLSGPSHGVLVRVGVQPGTAYREAAEPTEEPLARLPLAVSATSSRVFLTAFATIFQTLVLLTFALD